MKHKRKKIYKYLFITLLLGLNLLWFSGKANATDFEEIVPEGGVAPYPASPYIDDNKEQWLIEGEEDTVPSPRARKHNWEYKSFKEFENMLLNQYNNIGMNCDFDKPTYACSGILMRGLFKPGGNYYVPWSVSPKAKERGNVLSFTYLRKDLGFERFPFTYTAGFITYPTAQVPKKHKALRPLCYFPYDGYTDYRDEYGCGKTKEIVLKDRYDVVNTKYSRRCQDIGVRSFGRWVTHYNKSHRRLFYQEQCGFDLRNEKYATTNTQIGIQATNYIQNKTDTFRHSEIITSGWPSEEEGLIIDKVPFMAFFYIQGTGSESISGAQRMQKDYYDRTGVFVPVVQVKLPGSKNDNASFSVIRNIQHSEIPTETISD
ncbi:hypothetical protein HRD83_13190 [Enterococcus faecalis]|nr:hypothetical protein [Enterococcus faecalis]NSN09606.1 hypothetical protein [Enterococcus faecalis]NSU70502.1 hypothetical protein [Enterococcus faecalis]